MAAPAAAFGVHPQPMEGDAVMTLNQAIAFLRANDAQVGGLAATHEAAGRRLEQELLHRAFQRWVVVHNVDVDRERNNLEHVRARDHKVPVKLILAWTRERLLQDLYWSVSPTLSSYQRRCRERDVALHELEGVQGHLARALGVIEAQEYELARLQEREDQTDALVRELAAQRNVHTELQGRLAPLEARIRDLEAELEQSLQDDDSTVAYDEVDEHKDMEAQVVGLRATLEQRNEDVIQLQTTLAQRETELTLLRRDRGAAASASASRQNRRGTAPGDLQALMQGLALGGTAAAASSSSPASDTKPK